MVQAQPFLIAALPNIFAAISDKKSNKETSEAATTAAKSIFNKMSPNAVTETLPALFQAIHFETRWQTRVVGLEAICAFADHAPDQLGHGKTSVK